MSALRAGRDGDRRTFDGEVTKKLVGIGSVDELDQVDLGILCTNHGRDVDGCVLVERTGGLEGLFERRSLELEVCEVGDAGLLLDFNCRRCHDCKETRN